MEKQKIFGNNIIKEILSGQMQEKYDWENM